MSFLHRVKTFHHTVTRVHLKRRAVPLAALVLTTSMTFPVIAVGMDTYTVTDGTNTDTVVLHESNAETALRQSSFDAGEYNITSVVEDENGYTVSVKAKYDVTVAADGQTKTIHTGDARVSDILRQAGVEVGENDIAGAGTGHHADRGDYHQGHPRHHQDHDRDQGHRVLDRDP